LNGDHGRLKQVLHSLTKILHERPEMILMLCSIFMAGALWDCVVSVENYSSSNSFSFSFSKTEENNFSRYCLEELDSTFDEVIF